jgi:hypothetical protein
LAAKFDGDHLVGLVPHPETVYFAHTIILSTKNKSKKQNDFELLA